MRSLSNELINAGMASVAKPVGKVEVVSHPYMLGEHPSFTQFANMSGTGPRDAVELYNGSIIIIHETDGYKIITDHEDTDQWEAAWTAYSEYNKPSNFEALAIETYAQDVRIFARNSSTGEIYFDDSTNSGASFSGWVSTEVTPEESNDYVVAAARHDGLFIRHYADFGGVAITAVILEEGIEAWTSYSTKTGLIDTFPNFSYVGVTSVDNTDYIFFSCTDPRINWQNEGVMVMTFCGGAFSQPRHAVFYKSQEYAHYDMVRSLSTVGERNVLVIRSNRSSYVSPEPVHTISDSFDKYDDCILLISSLDSGDGWIEDDASISYSDTRIEGTNSIDIDPDVEYPIESVYRGSATLSYAFDASVDTRFTSDDYVTIAIRNVGEVTAPIALLRFLEDIGVKSGFSTTFNPSGGDWSFEYVKKSDMSGGSQWSDITHMFIQYQHSTLGDNGTCLFDHMTVCKADPDDADVPNPTGDVWDFQPTGSAWTITDDLDGYDNALACLSDVTGEKIAINTYDITTTVFTVSCATEQRDTGYTGIWFNSQDITDGSEDGYAFYIRPAYNTVYLDRYDAGSPTNLETSLFSCDIETTYYVGVSRVGDMIMCYVSTDESTLFNSPIIVTDDDTYENGNIGVIARDCNARFTDFTLSVYESDESIIADSNALAFMNDYHVGDMILFDSYPPRDVLVGDRYSFDIDDADGYIYRSSVVLDGTEDTITDDVINIALSYADEASSTARLTVYNADGRYNDGSIQRGAGIRVSLGYEIEGVAQYANMGLFRVNRLQNKFTSDGLELSVDCLDGNWLLKNWKAQAAHLIQSQNRMWFDFETEDDAAYFVNIADDAEFVWSSGRLRNTSSHAAMVLLGEEFYGVLAEARFRVPINASAAGGVMFASDDSASNLYLAHLSWTAGEVRLYKRVDDTWNLLDSESVTLYTGSMGIRVRHKNNMIDIWTASTRTDWTHRISYTDNSSPYLYGFVGIRGNVAGATEYVDVTKVQVASLNKDVSVHDAISEVATKAGILTVTPQYSFYDAFSGTEVDGTLWDTANSTIDSTTIVNNVHLRVSDSGIGYMRSSINERNAIIDFSGRICEGDALSVVFRMNTTLTNGYRIKITQGDESDSIVDLYRISNSTETHIYRHRPREYIQYGVWLDFRLSIDEEYVSLWMGEALLAVVFNATYYGPGYFGVASDETSYAEFDTISQYYCDLVVDSLAVNVGDNAEGVCRELAEICSARYYIEEDAEMKVGSMVPPSGSADVFGDETPLQFEDQLFEADVTTDDEDWVTHLRVVGEDGVSVDYYDRSDEGIDALGYRFDVMEASVTEIEDMKALAESTVADRNRSIVQRRLTGQGQVALQRGDRVTIRIYNVPGDFDSGYHVNSDFVVRSIQDVGFSRKPEPQFSMSMEIEDV